MHFWAYFVCQMLWTKQMICARLPVSFKDENVMKFCLDKEKQSNSFAIYHQDVQSLLLLCFILDRCL